MFPNDTIIISYTKSGPSLKIDRSISMIIGRYEKKYPISGLSIMKKLFVGLAAFCGVFLSAAASSETKIFGIGEGMTTAEILDELQTRDWITAEEAIPKRTVMADWATQRLKEFEDMTYDQRIRYYRAVKFDFWRDPFGEEIAVSNKNIKLEINKDGTLVKFLCGEKFTCVNQQKTLKELCNHLRHKQLASLGDAHEVVGGLDKPFCRLDTIVSPRAIIYELKSFGFELWLSDGSLSIRMSQPIYYRNIDTVYDELGIDVSGLRNNKITTGKDDEIIFVEDSPPSIFE